MKIHKLLTIAACLSFQLITTTPPETNKAVIYGSGFAAGKNGQELWLAFTANGIAYSVARSSSLSFDAKKFATYLKTQCATEIFPMINALNLAPPSLWHDGIYFAFKQSGDEIYLVAMNMQGNELMSAVVPGMATIPSSVEWYGSYITTAPITIKSNQVFGVIAQGGTTQGQMTNQITVPDVISPDLQTHC